MLHKYFLMCFFLFLQFFADSAMGMEKKDDEVTDEKISVTQGRSENVFKMRTQEDKKPYKFIVDEQCYNSLIKKEFSWLSKEDILPLEAQDFEINHSESLYLDTHWKAITTSDSPYPVLVTSNIYDCVALALMSPKKIGMYHVYPEDKGERVKNFVKYFIEKEDFGETKAILVTGFISPNLSRCYEILQETNINSIYVHTLKKIQLSNNKAILHPTALDKDAFMKNPAIFSDLFAMIAIDARTMSIALNFNIKKYQEEAKNCMDKVLEARNIGMYFKFNHED